MTLHLHFILLNSDYNQSIADDFHNGEESEDNIKHLWEDELALNEPVEDFKITHQEPYTLQGALQNNESFSYDIQNVTLVKCVLKSGKNTVFAVSKKLIKKTDKVVHGTDTHLYFYLRDTSPFQNPTDGVYIVNEDFPKQLKKQDSESHG